MDGPTFVHIWAALTGLGGLLRKKKGYEVWRGGEGGRSGKELEGTVEGKCDQNTLCTSVK